MPQWFGLGLGFLLTVASFDVPTWAGEFQVPASTKQLIVIRGRDWNATELRLTRWERINERDWIQIGETWRARGGRNGMAWGLGDHPEMTDPVVKREGDGRTPAGVFRLGSIYGDWKDGSRFFRWPYVLVTPRDMWIDDPSSAFYNRFVRLDRDLKTPWELRQQMRQKDPAHALKIFLHHNSGENVRAGAGSAIFIHMWRRGGEAVSAGCPVIHPESMKTLARWLDPAAAPLCVILPDAEFDQRRSSWGLP